MSEPLRVLLLEDSEADAELVIAELRRAGLDCVCHRVDTRTDFVEALRVCRPHVVLADHGIAQWSSLAALADVKVQLPSAAFIVLSGGVDERIAVTAIRAGADDVINKRNLSSVPALVRASVAARRGLHELSARQIEVLRLIASGHTTPVIARLLRISPKTVDSHRTNLMKRLDIHDIAHLVRYALQLGLI